jgi:16S rRNA (adenine1518-N6/adenine1519-N6)-dimethyltransferase
MNKHLDSHIARKRFGQNFLTDPNIITAIIDCINPLSGDHIVEIGPGQAALTQGLIASGARVDAIELDRDLAELLRIDLAKYKNFNLYEGDILKFDLYTLLLNDKTHKLRLVGNLPYNISTPLLLKLFDNIAIISDMHFMLQKEVAERLVATPDNKQYGRLSILAQYYCEMQIVLDVPPTAFNPAPKVESSVIQLIPHAKPPVEVKDLELLQQITAAAFNQRRKTISNSLKELITAAELQQLQIDPKLRAENLTLAQYAIIVNYLNR